MALPTDWLKSIVDLLNPSEKKRKDLIDQFYLSLDTSFQRIKASAEQNEHLKLLETLELSFQQPRTWRSAYHIEQLLLPLYDDEKLTIELTRRLIDVKCHLKPELGEFYEKAVNQSDHSLNHALLGRMVSDLQWNTEVEQAHHHYNSCLRVRTALAFDLSLLLFFLPQLIPGILDTFAVLQVEKSQLIMTALLSGWMGAAFSMLLSMNKRVKACNLEALMVISQYSHIFTRVIIGMGAGLIFFYLMEAKIISSPLLPQFNYDEKDGLSMIDLDLAKLIVWCFLAGFSEQMVPNILSKTARKLEDPKREG